MTLADECIDGAAQVLCSAMSAVRALDCAVTAAERAERLRDISWALYHASALLNRAADIEERRANED